MRGQVTETIDERITRIQAQLAARHEVYDSEIAWLCEQLVRAREVVRRTMDNYDSVTAKLYLESEE